MRPAAILAIVSDIVINDHHVILEFGSGNSTVFAARALSHHGIRGHVHSVDHDPAWAALTARAIARESLQPWASVTCAPLVDGWYDKLRLPTVEAIDLLVVDGPPAFERGTETAREPALDVFRERLSPNATIVLDDSWRRGEKRVMAGWQQRHGIEWPDHRGGLAVARMTAASPSTIERGSSLTTVSDTDRASVHTL